MQSNSTDQTHEKTPKVLGSENKPECEINFSELAQGKKEVRITHNGEIYRLRVTKNGKLILNK